MSQTSKPGLTQEDLERLREISEHGPRVVTTRDPARGGEPVTCHRCDHTWTYTGTARNPECPQCRTRTIPHTDPDLKDTRGVSLRCCNAIRCAALDGWSFSKIARVSSVISSVETARLHARGECRHGETRVPVLREARGPGFNNTVKVTERDCRRLREEWDAGCFESYAAAGRAFDCFRTTARIHITGECMHD